MARRRTSTYSNDDKIGRRRMKMNLKISSSSSSSSSSPSSATPSFCKWMDIDDLTEIHKTLMEFKDSHVKNRRYRLKTYKNVFLGNELVDFLQLKSRCQLPVNRPAALELCRRLYNKGLIFHVLGEHEFEPDPTNNRVLDEEDDKHGLSRVEESDQDHASQLSRRRIAEPYEESADSLLLPVIPVDMKNPGRRRSKLQRFFSVKSLPDSTSASRGSSGGSVNAAASR
eukprot:jgi/Bigna1/129153/aug1.8_g3861